MVHKNSLQQNHYSVIKVPVHQTSMLFCQRHLVRKWKK